MGSSILAYRPDVAIPPGETLRETLEVIGMSQAELGRRSGRPLKTINEIVMGKTAISADTALQLERVLGIEAAFWSNLERQFQETKAALRANQETAKQTIKAKHFPYTEMAEMGWVPRVADPVGRTQALFSFFGVNSFSALDKTYAAAFRRSGSFKASREALLAWLRQGEIIAKTISTKPFDHAAFEKFLHVARTYTTTAPEEFYPKLAGGCAACGVRLVLVPALSKTHVDGAARWLGKGRALIQLSVRYKWDDRFWFSFFHEAGHLLLHGTRQTFVDERVDARDRQEEEASRFAGDLLIPSEEYQRWVHFRDLSRAAILQFARRIGVAGSIVLGRLQHDKLVPWNRHTGLRRKFHIVPAPLTAS